MNMVQAKLNLYQDKGDVQGRGAAGDTLQTVGDNQARRGQRADAVQGMVEQPSEREVKQGMRLRGRGRSDCLVQGPGGTNVKTIVVFSLLTKEGSI